ncbi:MAG TPA: glycerophosphodiester phosphodiesterase family protein [Allosphingosinicella sp.]
MSPFDPIDSALAPAPDPKRVAGLTDTPYAHRGLHGAGRIENSRSAFDAAIAAGHGIELDVQASADGEAFVIHDYDLGRLTGSRGKVAERNSAELKAIGLAGTEEMLAPLSDILASIAGRVPLLIELKAPNRRVGRLCGAVRRALEGYGGTVGIMSFNPEVGRWFAWHAPHLARGLVVTESGKKGLRGRFERHLSLWRARPDFLAFDIRDLPSRFAARQRARGLPVLTWTVRTAAERARAAAHADQIIYELGPDPL